MSTDLMVPESTTVVANSPDQLGDLQAPLAGWAKQKLELVRAEPQG